MKIIKIHRSLTNQKLYNHLSQNINPLFNQQRQNDINFKTENTGDAVEISHPGLYDGFLFRIQIDGNELHITRSEHYTDDVNSLTIESIINGLFAELAGKKGLEIVQEG
jgi:hypothetical protein